MFGVEEQILEANGTLQQHFILLFFHSVSDPTRDFFLAIAVLDPLSQQVHLFLYI